MNLTSQFRKELDYLLESFQFYKNEMMLQDSKIKDLNSFLIEQEFIISQLNEYISHSGLIIGEKSE